jgi:thymidylate kinase
MRILMEGLDLAGKSTVCRRFIAQARGSWVIRRNSLVENNRVYAIADELRRADALADEPLGWLYLAALHADLAELAASQTADNQDILQDSTILVRSVAHHSSRGRQELVEQFVDLAPAMPRFDHAFVCVADRETRLRRLARRRPENLGPDDFLVRDDYAMFSRMQEKVIDLVTSRFGGVVVDTSGLEDEERLTMIFDRLPELERSR